MNDNNDDVSITSDTQTLQENCLHCALLKAIAEFSDKFGKPVDVQLPPEIQAQLKPGTQPKAIDARYVLEALAGVIVSTLDPMPAEARGDLILHFFNSLQGAINKRTDDDEKDCGVQSGACRVH